MDIEIRRLPHGGLQQKVWIDLTGNLSSDPIIEVLSDGRTRMTGPGQNVNNWWRSHFSVDGVFLNDWERTTKPEPPVIPPGSLPLNSKHPFGNWGLGQYSMGKGFKQSFFLSVGQIVTQDWGQNKMATYFLLAIAAIPEGFGTISGKLQAPTGEVYSFGPTIGGANCNIPLSSRKYPIQAQVNYFHDYIDPGNWILSLEAIEDSTMSIMWYAMP